MIPISPYLQKTFENKKILSRINKIISDIRGKSFIMPKKNSSVILVVSGGLDSIPLWLMLLKKYHLKVYPVYFDNGSKQQKKAVLFYSSLFKKRFPKQSSSLIITKKNYPTYNYKYKNKKELFSNLTKQFIQANLIYHKTLKKIGVFFHRSPTRLFHFNIFASELAYYLNIKSGENINTVFTGIVPDDSLVSRESTLMTIRAVNLAVILIFGNENWQCQAPLDKENNFYFTKKDLVSYAIKNHLDLKKTWSCNFSGQFHCGKCSSCLSRKNTFAELKIKDPTIYKKYYLELLLKKIADLLLCWLRKPAKKRL